MVPRSMIMDSPYFQKTLSVPGMSQSVQTTPIESATASTQTTSTWNEVQLKVSRYEQMLRAESTANEELTE
jgi:hypothetical protein